jgi:SAM-dependent methyltransferase
MPRGSNVDGHRKQGLIDALQGYYATIILLELRRIGLLSQIVKPNTPEKLARELGVDLAMTRGLLDFLALTTNVVRKTGRGAYQLNDPGYAELSFQLEKFAGAYGPATEAIGETLQYPEKCADHVDRRALATAFSEVESFRSSFVADLISASGVSCLLDLGCGPASLLVDLALKNPAFHGVGIDASVFMCRQARHAARAAGVTRRIEIRHADARNLSQWLSPALRARVDGVHGSSFLNEFFGWGELEAVKMLRELSRSFPGRKAWFVDYYSSIRQRKGNRKAADFPLALLQDLAQIVSGQGVPPANVTSWRRLYKRTGCRSVRVHEFESENIRWFIQEVTL